MKYFLTGISEVVYQSLTRSLVGQGAEVTVLATSLSFSAERSNGTHPNVKICRIAPCDTQSLAEAMLGHEVVINMIPESRTGPQQGQMSVAETCSLLDAARQARVRRFVQISSILVYGDPPNSQMYTEDSPKYASLSSFASVIQEIELAILQTASMWTEVVILQPGVIYGPGYGCWMSDMLTILQKGIFPLFDGGQGFCNAIYVDDLVRAVLKASTLPAMGQECFIITNNQPVRWSEFLQALDGIVGQNSLVHMPSFLMRTLNRWSEYNLLCEYRYGVRLVRTLIKALQFPTFNRSVPEIDSQTIRYFTAKPHFSNQKSREILDFNPKVDLEMGMKSVKAWYQSQQLVRENP